MVLVLIFDHLVVLVELLHHFVDVPDDLFALTLETLDLRASSRGVVLVAIDVTVAICQLGGDSFVNFVVSLQVLVDEVFIHHPCLVVNAHNFVVKEVNFLLQIFIIFLHPGDFHLALVIVVVELALERLVEEVLQIIHVPLNSGGLHLVLLLKALQFLLQIVQVVLRDRFLVIGIFKFESVL